MSTFDDPDKKSLEKCVKITKCCSFSHNIFKQTKDEFHFRETLNLSSANAFNLEQASSEKLNFYRHFVYCRIYFKIYSFAQLYPELGERQVNLINTYAYIVIL